MIGGVSMKTWTVGSVMAERPCLARTEIQAFFGSKKALTDETARRRVTNEQR